ncbi:MAG: glycosyltransferase [Patescibacteria group bacterium]
MHFACISTITKKTTPDVPSGQEIWTAKFILEEVKRGHTVDLFAVKGSLNVPGKIDLHPTLEKEFDQLKNEEYFRKYQDKEIRYFFGAVFTKIALQLKKYESKYSFILDSSNYPPLPPNADQYQVPYIIVVHTPGNRKYVSFFEYFPYPKNLYYIFPSMSEYKKATMIPDDSKFYIPHGIDIEEYKYLEDDQKANLLWFGRIDSRLPKGAIEALVVSNTLKINLNFYFHNEDDDYFEKSIKPLFSSYTLVNLNAPKSSFFKNAKLFIFAGSDKELFGLVLLEAMATGTPIVCYARGAVPEIVQDGKTGFIVNPSDDDIRGDWSVKKTGIEGLSEAVERIYSMSENDYRTMRKNCRAHVEKNFTIERMVDEYEKVYNQVVYNSK